MSDIPSRCVGLVAILLAIAAATSCDPARPASDADGDVDGDADADAGRDADQVGPDASPDGDSPCLPDPDADAADADLDADADADGDIDADAEADADAEVDGDAEVDADSDLEPCPDDMVGSGRICIDTWESSRTDATAGDQGTAVDRAWSRPGVMPWSVNPMSLEALSQFEAACAAAGKRLCAADEWAEACSGPAGSSYVYGDVFDREVCNCVDTFCDDYCAVHPEVDPCDLAANCGYTYYSFHVVPTESFPGCTNALGTFDINGNLWEVVTSTTDARGYEVRGGAFNCASAATRVGCVFDAGWDALYAGFRCCRDR
jgi:hypothetical protein